MMRWIARGLQGRPQRTSTLVGYASKALKSSAAITLGIGLLSGCKDWRAPATSMPAASTSAESEGVTANSSRMIGVDEQDDSRAPAYLPTTESSGGRWVKREAVRVYAAGELGELFDEATVRRLTPFRLKSAAQCVYALRRTQGRAPMAKVIGLEMLSAEDAYGVLTCRSASAETYRIGGETRVERNGGLSFHCWQGRCYLYVSCPAEDAEATEEMIRLLMTICGRISREEVPAILSLLPTEGRPQGRVWLIRRAESLPVSVAGLEAVCGTPRMSEVLGLGRDTLMCVAAYDVAEATRPNVIWVVHYPSIKSAHDAYARYSRLIDAGQEAMARSSNVMPPRGSYLIGSWTAEEESLQYMLPRVAELLPS